jgi:preprotein translocase subunit SecE
VEEALPALQQAYAAQGNEVGMTSMIMRTRDFTVEVAEELKKVTWPDVSQLKSATLVSIVFMMIVSVIIWVMDFGVRQVLKVVMGIFT